MKLLFTLIFLTATFAFADSKGVLKNHDFSKGTSLWKGDELSREKDPDDKSNSVLLVEKVKNKKKNSKNLAMFGQSYNFPRKKLTIIVKLKARILEKGKTKLTVHFTEKATAKGGKSNKFAEISGKKWQEFETKIKLDNTKGHANYIFFKTGSANIPAFLVDDVIITYNERE